MKKLNLKVFEPVDEEEKAIMESIENDQWVSVTDFKEEKEKAESVARQTLKKNKHINLRLTEKDYHQIQIKAIQKGIPYQTLIASIIHKYLNGSLVSKTSE